jgi:hypothetical protein
METFDAELREIVNTIMPENQDGSGGVVVVADDETQTSSSVTAQDVPEDAKRNALYTELLDRYIGDYAFKVVSKRRYKTVFFVATMVMFFMLVIAPIAAILVVALNGQGSISDVSVVIGSVAGIISAIIVLPKIIAEYLFPVDEETHLIEIVRTMQNIDLKIREIRSDRAAKGDTRSAG